MLKQISALRSRVDPEVLARVRLAVESAQTKGGVGSQAGIGKAIMPHGAVSDDAPSHGEVPYDRETAFKAVALFLAGRPDGVDMGRELIEALKRRNENS